MQNLADAVLDYFWLLEFSEEESLDPDDAVKLEEELIYRIENDFTEAEKQALQEAAARRLQWYLREPDEHGHTPQKLLTKGYLFRLSVRPTFWLAFGSNGG